MNLHLARNLHWYAKGPMSESTAIYQARFGLDKQPFSMTPDHGMLYLTPTHREALAGLTYALMAKKGFVVLTGEVGTGKTTLLSRVIRHLPQNRFKPSIVVNPRLTCREFLEMAFIGWGVSNPPESKPQRLLLLCQMLASAREAGQSMMLVVDEAHALSMDVLEELRLLGNYENQDEKFLQIVLAGQSELTDVLNREDMRQVKQRIAVRLNITRLSAAEVEEYIRYRWTRAGGAEIPFSGDAMIEIGRFSRGIPRMINAICDNALVLTAAGEPTPLGPEPIRQACHELCLAPPAASTPPRLATVLPPPTNPGTQPNGITRLSDSPELLNIEPPLKSLERYASANRKSFLARWADRFTA